MTFRTRLALFFLGVLAVPLVVGAILVSNVSRTQALRDADSRLQVASLTATTALQRESFAMSRDLSSAVAVRAARTRTSAGLDAIRTSEGLDFLLVLRPGQAAAASIDLPPGLPNDAATIDAGALRGVAAQRRVTVTGANAATVVGGRIWRPELPPSLDVQAALVVGGHRAGGGSFTSSVRPASVGDARLVCVCRGGGADAAGLVLSTPARWEGLGQWLRWPRVGILVLGIVALVLLAYLLAELLTRPLTQLAWQAEAVARGDPEPPPIVDPAVGREFGRMERSLRSVSATLSDSRDQLGKARGRLVATERLTVLDPLTGVWNRRGLDRALREQVKRNRRFDRPFGLLMIDVDRFKRVNDAHGHAAGDAVLVSMSRAISEALREDLDVLARFGGEEFVVVLPETDVSGTQVVAEKLRSLIAESVFEYGGHDIPITVSIGVAACPEDGLDGRRLMAAADAALYRAKAAGRNRTVAASSSRPQASEG